MTTALFDRPLRGIPIWLAVIWCLLVILLAYLGTFPHQYLLHVRGISAPQPYPVAFIAIEALVAAMLMAALGWACVATRWRRVARLALASVFVGTVGVLAALGTMHMPQHYLYFALSMLALALLSMLALACFTIAGCAHVLATRLATRQSRRATGI